MFARCDVYIYFIQGRDLCYRFYSHVYGYSYKIFFFIFSHAFGLLMAAFYYAICLLVLRITAYFLSILMSTVLC